MVHHPSNHNNNKWTSWFAKPFGWLHQPSNHTTTNILGNTWDSTQASQAYSSGELRSKGGGAPLRLVFCNATPLPLVLCWISENGTPHHFYKLEPSCNELLVANNNKIEYSSVNHAFTFSLFDEENNANTSDDEEKKDSSSEKLLPDSILGGYRPNCASIHHNIDNPIHLVTITRKRKLFDFCRAPWGLVNKKGRFDSEYEYSVVVEEYLIKDDTPIDTSDKHYDCMFATSCKWPVRLEPKWHNGNNELKKKLMSDLQAALKCLPKHARDALRKDTPLWVNCSQKYGPAECPIMGRGMCFHPGAGWLRSNGMSVKKEGGVELYNSKGYTRDAKLWGGPGGLLLHEFCHAYHFKCLKDGYDNKEVWDCYNKAMEEGLYDCVEVHGSKTPTKAYACTNAMEYFAELSVAYLGGLKDDIEYNKWFPFNRRQLQQHDPRAYKLLERLWNHPKDPKPLGDVWDSSSASQAFLSRELRSRGGGAPVRIAFRNKTPTRLTLCWINEQGRPKHFYAFEPWSENKLGNDNMITKSDKIENSIVNHAFSFSLFNENDVHDDGEQKSDSEDENTAASLNGGAHDDSEGESDSDESSTDGTLEPKNIVGGYRPSCVSNESDDEEDEEQCIHLVTVTRKPRGDWWNLFKGPHDFDWIVSVERSRSDTTPIDTSDKHYHKSVLGGWPVRLESDWNDGNKELEERLAADLAAASKLLPPHACAALKKDTLLYINRFQEYGPAVCPIVGDGMCFHPDSEWLIENGMSPQKKGCVELYNALEYMEDCDHWGLGGVMLHELSHAYHHKCIKDGYDNKDILACYNKAMKEGLYECVKVHGSQGPTAKAYACTDAMEYFAELSVAFLGGASKKEEFNKWFPFNRHQLKQHDPRAYKLLQRVWKVDFDKTTKRR